MLFISYIISMIVEERWIGLYKHFSITIFVLIDFGKSRKESAPRFHEP